MTTHTPAEPSAQSPAPLPPTMAAWHQARYGGPDAQRRGELGVPTPGKHDLLIRVAATGIHAGDVRVMRGDPWLVRLATGIRRPRVAVRGMDVAGTVVATGVEVAGFGVGDEVVAEIPWGGGLAEYAIVPVVRAVRRPDAVPSAAAAVLPVSGGTAWQALESGGVRAGSRVLIVGASGGVGTYAVQLAAHRGADVWALTGARTAGLVTDLGASRVFDYTTVQPGSPELPTDSFDAVIDIAGTAPLRALQQLVRVGGTVVLVSGHGGRVLGPTGRMLAAMFLSRPTRRIRALAATAKPEILQQLLALTADGAIAPVIERTYPFDEAVGALAHVDAGHTVGKVVVLQD